MTLERAQKLESFLHSAGINLEISTQRRVGLVSDAVVKVFIKESYY